MKKYGKFAALIVVVIGTLVWLATAGMKETQTYYKTISELTQMKDEAYNKRLRVAGDVENGSITRVGNEVRFVLTQDANTHLKVAYYGTDPLPDTFKDGAQALADGKLAQDGVFHANKIQAKCASKYEAKPGQYKTGEGSPNVNTGNKRT
jgi:cytochrome c-type biogenesis protein CcmE